MPAEGRENHLLKKGNSDAFFREKYLTKNIKSYAALFLKVSASLVAGRTGCAFDPAQDNLSTGVRLLAVIAVNTEIFGVIERTFVIPI